MNVKKVLMVVGSLAAVAALVLGWCRPTRAT